MTLSMMFFVYALIVLLIFLIAMINIQPFKITVRYPSTDSIFCVFLSLSYIAVLGRDMASTEKYFYNTTMTGIAMLSAFVPIFYITYFIFSWLISKRRWINFL